MRGFVSYDSEFRRLLIMLHAEMTPMVPRQVRMRCNTERQFQTHRLGELGGRLRCSRLRRQLVLLLVKADTGMFDISEG